MPSRPGEFHPESLTDPDVILSHHPARATKRRLPLSAERSGSSRFNPVGPCSTAMTCLLSSAGITPLRCYYEAVRPSPAHRYFRPRGYPVAAFQALCHSRGSLLFAHFLRSCGIGQSVLWRIPRLVTAFTTSGGAGPRLALTCRGQRRRDGRTSPSRFAGPPAAGAGPIAWRCFPADAADRPCRTARHRRPARAARSGRRLR
jgi:hypothetical protein